MLPILIPEAFTANICQKFITTIKSIKLDTDWIICISEHTKHDFCAYTGMNPDKVFVTPLAAGNHFYTVTNLDYITTVRKRYQLSDSPYLLSLCTLEPRKTLTF